MCIRDRDNVDFHSKSISGDFHGTNIAVYQTKKMTEEAKLVLDRCSSRSYKLSPIYNLKPCEQPELKPLKFANYLDNIDLTTIDLYSLWDTAWSFMRSSEVTSKSVPVWNAFNSLLTETSDQTTYYSLPLLRNSPTDWSTHYTTLCICQDLNTFSIHLQITK